MKVSKEFIEHRSYVRQLKALTKDQLIEILLAQYDVIKNPRVSKELLKWIKQSKK